MLRRYILQEDPEQKKSSKAAKKKVCEMIVESTQRSLENEGQKCSGMDDTTPTGNIASSTPISDGSKSSNNGTYPDVKSEQSSLSVNVGKNDSHLVAGSQTEFKDGEKSAKSKKEIRPDSGKSKQNPQGAESSGERQRNEKGVVKGDKKKELLDKADRPKSGKSKQNNRRNEEFVDNVLESREEESSGKKTKRNKYKQDVKESESRSTSGNENESKHNEPEAEKSGDCRPRSGKSTKGRNPQGGPKKELSEKLDNNSQRRGHNRGKQNMKGLFLLFIFYFYELTYVIFKKYFEIYTSE